MVRGGEAVASVFVLTCVERANSDTVQRASVRAAQLPRALRRGVAANDS